jgi:hypothetical protein
MEAGRQEMERERAGRTCIRHDLSWNIRWFEAPVGSGMSARAARAARAESGYGSVVYTEYLSFDI